jgi:hypothetical protein
MGTRIAEETMMTDTLWNFPILPDNDNIQTIYDTPDFVPTTLFGIDIRTSNAAMDENGKGRILLVYPQHGRFKVNLTQREDGVFVATLYNLDGTKVDPETAAMLVNLMVDSE